MSPNISSHTIVSPSLVSPSTRRGSKRGCSGERPGVIKRMRLQDQNLGARKVLFPVRMEHSAIQSPDVTVSVLGLYLNSY